MKKGQVYEGVVERVDFPNKGVVRVGEETCIVKNSLPGQKVSFCVNKLRKGKAEGRLLEVTVGQPVKKVCALTSKILQHSRKNPPVILIHQPAVV